MTVRLGVIACFISLLLTGTTRAETRATVQAGLNYSALKAGSEAMIAVVVDIPQGLHAQSHTPTEKTFIAFTVKLDPTDGITFGEPLYPPGEDKTYPQLGKLNVYEGQVIVHVPVTVSKDAKLGAATIAGTVRLQLCDENVCYRPRNEKVELAATVVDGSTAVTPANAAWFANVAPAEPKNTNTAASTESTIAEPPTAVWLWFVTAFFTGIIFNLMPCVLPVLPIKAMGFYKAAQESRVRSVVLSLAFSVGIVAIFTALAVLIFVTKKLTWGQQFSNPYFVWSIVAVLGIMGIGLMGAFAIRLPTVVYNISPKHDSIGGNVAFGALTAILSTPCTAPLLPGVLLWAQTQPTHLSVPAMITVGLGMAFPYIILSAFPQLARKMPRVGPWADLFKQMLGWLLIGSAVYFAAGRLIEGNKFLWAIVAVAVVAGIYLITRTIQLGAQTRGVGFAALIAAAFVFSTGAWAAHMNKTVVDWQPYSDTALQEARAAGRPVLVKFTANWCANCQYIESTVFKDERTAKAFKDGNVLALKSDLTFDDAPGSKLLIELNPTGGIPLTALYFPDTAEPVQLTSIYTTQTLLNILGRHRSVAVVSNNAAKN